MGLPLRTALLGRQEAPSASVIVGLKPGYKLSSLQLQGIVNLVSNSVPRLVPQRVTVVDASGKLLQSGAGGPNGKMAKLYQLRLDLERTMEERIESMLLPVLGLNKAVARVSLEIDVRETELTKQEFDPSGKVVRSRRLQVGEPDASTEGIPGVQGNIPGGDAEKPADKTEEKSGDEPKETPRTKKSEMVTYELDHSTKRIIEPQGLIRRLSVAVMVDGKYEEDVYTPRTEEEMETLRAIIKRAVGFNEKRGDQLEMTNVPFRPQSELHPVVVKVPEPQQWFQSPFILAGGAAVFLLLLLTVGLLFRSGRRKSRARVSVRRARTQVTEGISGAVEKIEKITVSADPRREQLAQIARDYHDLTIQIIRMWLKEGRKGRPDVLNMIDEVEKEQEIEKAAQGED